MPAAKKQQARTLSLQPKERQAFTAADIPFHTDHGHHCTVGAGVANADWEVEVGVNQMTGDPERPDAIFDVRIFGGTLPQVAFSRQQSGVSFWCSPEDLNQLAGMLLDAGKAARQLLPDDAG